VEQKNCDG